MAGDGSMIRARITPTADNRKLYRQRLAAPGPGSDFASWTYTNQQACLAVCAASTDTEVLIFYITSSREMKYIRSTDYGQTWQNPQLFDYAATANVSGFACAVKPNGDIALFYCIEGLLYVKKRVSGTWQSKTYWDKTTGDLSGVAAVYSTDWDLVVTGRDTSDNYRIWSIIYGDGGEITTGTWSTLKEIASAPSDGDYEFKNVFMDKPDVCRTYFIEKFTGTEAYSRPFSTQTLPDSPFIENLWLEPQPFDFLCEYGTVIAHSGNNCWLSVPAGVWRATTGEQRLELSADVTGIRQISRPFSGNVVVHLGNDNGQYASLPEPLDIGCRLDFSPGCVTSTGEEFSTGQSFILEGYEYTSECGKAELILNGIGGWERLQKWTAVCQFRFNRTANEYNVRQIMEFVLARAGLKLQIISQSGIISGFFPDFIIHTGSSGETVVRKLLSFVPDHLFIEGDSAYILNPLEEDEPLYSYGVNHPIFKGQYTFGTQSINLTTVEGLSAGGEKILKDSFNWDSIAETRLRGMRIIDRNLASVTEAAARGETYLEKAEKEWTGGFIDVPVNCGQQLFDVIDITDKRAGLEAVKKRITGIEFEYMPAFGRYRQRFGLGGVG
jgi:hypothetical protein